LTASSGASEFNEDGNVDNRGLITGESEHGVLFAGSTGLGDSFTGSAGSDTLQVTGTASASLLGFNAASSGIEVLLGNGKGPRHLWRQQFQLRGAHE
jgi:hypothetical protein